MFETAPFTWYDQHDREKTKQKKSRTRLIVDYIGLFCDPQPHVPIFSEKVEIFIIINKSFGYIMCVK